MKYTLFHHVLFHSWRRWNIFLLLLLKATWPPEYFSSHILQFSWTPKHFNHLFSPTTWSLPTLRYPATLFIQSLLYFRHIASCESCIRATNIPTTPRVIIPEDISFEDWRNIGTPWTLYSTLSRNPKSHIPLLCWILTVLFRCTR
jgi:hypothetical protein